MFDVEETFCKKGFNLESISKSVGRVLQDDATLPISKKEIENIYMSTSENIKREMCAFLRQNFSTKISF